jgi:integrase
MITTGLRPGEALGLQWRDVDLDDRTLTVQRSLSRPARRRPDQAEGEGQPPADPWALTEPKTRAGVRAIPLDEHTAEILRRHRAGQNEERLRLGTYYGDRGFVFAAPQGEPLDWHNIRARHFKPAAARAARTCAACGKRLVPTGDDRHLEHEGGRRFDHDAAPRPELARLRPYDLRHLCASLLLAIGTDLKTVSQRLGHANAGFTLETYTHVVPGTQAAAAEAIGEEVFGKAKQERR